MTFWKSEIVVPHSIHILPNVIFFIIVLDEMP